MGPCDSCSSLFSLLGQIWCFSPIAQPVSLPNNKSPHHLVKVKITFQPISSCFHAELTVFGHTGLSPKYQILNRNVGKREREKKEEKNWETAKSLNQSKRSFGIREFTPISYKRATGLERKTNYSRERNTIVQGEREINKESN